MQYLRIGGEKSMSIDHKFDYWYITATKQKICRQNLFDKSQKMTCMGKIRQNFCRVLIRLSVSSDIPRKEAI